MLDFRVGVEDAEPVCDALNRRAVPFIFFTGLSGALPPRFAATPVVSKPAEPRKIVGALKFVLRGILSSSPNAAARIVSGLRGSVGLWKSGSRACAVASNGWQRAADTSAAEQVIATTLELIEGIRAHREMSAHIASKLGR